LIFTVGYDSGEADPLLHSRHTIDYDCRYKCDDIKLKLLRYSDADMGGDVDTRKSTTGVFPVTWQSQKEMVVAHSSCEDEYITGTTAAYQGVWLVQLLSELKSKQRTTFVLKTDNQSAISLSKISVLHDPSKHIDVRFHSIPECVGDWKWEIEHVRTEEQIADILTNPLTS
jgi:hypothetical protein